MPGIALGNRLWRLDLGVLQILHSSLCLPLMSSKALCYFTFSKMRLLLLHNETGSTSERLVLCGIIYITRRWSRWESEAKTVWLQQNTYCCVVHSLYTTQVFCYCLIKQCRAEYLCLEVTSGLSCCSYFHSTIHSNAISSSIANIHGALWPSVTTVVRKTDVWLAH